MTPRWSLETGEGLSRKELKYDEWPSYDFEVSPFKEDLLGDFRCYPGRLPRRRCSLV